MRVPRGNAELEQASDRIAAAILAAGHEPFIAWREIERGRLASETFMPFVRRHIQNCGLLLALYHPELRGGLIEMGVAYASSLPIWLAHRPGEPVSSSALGSASRALVYTCLADLSQQLRSALMEITLFPSPKGDPVPDDRLRCQLQFLAEIDKVKQIVRRTMLIDGSRFENDAEHSWHMAIFAAWMGEHAAAKTDLLKAVKMCLIHDVVEIDAGDAYAFDPAAQAGRVARERRAAERIFGLLPGDQAAEVRALWEEFEAGQTPEAQYAVAMDRAQSVLNQFHAQGKSWKAHGVKGSQVLQRIKPVREPVPRLWEHLNQLVTHAMGRGWLAQG